MIVNKTSELSFKKKFMFLQILIFLFISIVLIPDIIPTRIIRCVIIVIWASDSTTCRVYPSLLIGNLILLYLLLMHLMLVHLILIRLQARIQSFKEVKQTDKIQNFPLEQFGHQDVPLLLFAFRQQLEYAGLVLISATDLQSILQNINKFAVGQTRSIFTNAGSSRSHEFCNELCKTFQNTYFL